MLFQKRVVRNKIYIYVFIKHDGFQEWRLCQCRTISYHMSTMDGFDGEHWPRKDVFRESFVRMYFVNLFSFNIRAKRPSKQ